jgi:hypothetical protein
MCRLHCNLVCSPIFIFVSGPELTSTAPNFNITRCRHQLTTSPFYPVSPPTHRSIQCRHQLTALSSVATSSPLYPVSPPAHLYMKCRHQLCALSSVPTCSPLYPVSPPTHLYISPPTHLYISPPTHRSIQCRLSSVMYLKPWKDVALQKSVKYVTTEYEHFLVARSWVEFRAGLTQRRIVTWGCLCDICLCNTHSTVCLNNSIKT